MTRSGRGGGGGATETGVWIFCLIFLALEVGVFTTQNPDHVSTISTDILTTITAPLPPVAFVNGTTQTGWCAIIAIDCKISNVITGITQDWQSILYGVDLFIYYMEIILAYSLYPISMIQLVATYGVYYPLLGWVTAIVSGVFVFTTFHGFL